MGQSILEQEDIIGLRHKFRQEYLTDGATRYHWRANSPSSEFMVGFPAFHSPTLFPHHCFHEKCPQNHENSVMKIPRAAMTVALNSETDIVPNCRATDPFDGGVMYLKPQRTAVVRSSERLKHTTNFRARMHSWCCITAEDVKILSHPGHGYPRRVVSRAAWICRAWCFRTFHLEDFFSSEDASCMRRETFLDSSQKKQLF